MKTHSNSKIITKIILGIDPGYDRLGICILEKKSQTENNLLFSACLESQRTENLNQRIFDLTGKIKKIILKWQPTELAIEKLFFTTNQKTVMGVSEARGVIIYLAQTLNLKVFEYTPLQIKIALTGYGKADKDQVKFMVKKILIPPPTPPNGRGEIHLDDEYDAIACALTHSASVK